MKTSRKLKTLLLTVGSVGGGIGLWLLLTSVLQDNPQLRWFGWVYVLVALTLLAVRQALVAQDNEKARLRAEREFLRSGHDAVSQGQRDDASHE